MSTKMKNLQSFGFCLQGAELTALLGVAGCFVVPERFAGLKWLLICQADWDLCDDVTDDDSIRPILVAKEWCAFVLEFECHHMEGALWCFQLSPRDMQFVIPKLGILVRLSK